MNSRKFRLFYYNDFRDFRILCNSSLGISGTLLAILTLEFDGLLEVEPLELVWEAEALLTLALWISRDNHKAVRKLMNR
ncbi:hypothetical protein VNO77_05213 [Canavalia gladiata]|uniref:Uncharacterized protein n=1 Tax=Canavalia gladiata TaxID=3824 RepID=A0AAN9N3M3_CANGL